MRGLSVFIIAAFLWIHAHAASADMWQVNGSGGVYFLVEPGQFKVELDIQLLKPEAAGVFVRAILAAPDRTVLHDQYISAKDKSLSVPDRANIYRLSLNADVSRRGVYVLNLTQTRDRFGRAFNWSIKTNAGKFLIESSRGHEDKAHEEPLWLRNREVAGNVCFLPRKGKFTIEASALVNSVTNLTLFDGAGKLISDLPVKDGTAKGAFEAKEIKADQPWRLHFSAFQGDLHIDGVTRWKPGETYENFSIWTPCQSSWFPLHSNRWLLAPYSHKQYVRSQSQGTAAFQLHNNATVKRAFNVTVSDPSGALKAMVSPEGPIVVAAKSIVNLTLTYTVPAAGESWSLALQATPVETPEFSTYSTLHLIKGSAPADKLLSMPILLKPYCHENVQFGYDPDYPTEQEMYFDLNNRPAALMQTKIAMFNGEKWVETAAIDGSSISMLKSKIAFDSDNNMYALARVKGKDSLLRSCDKGKTFTASVLPMRGVYDIEQFSGHNQSAGPPPFVVFTTNTSEPKAHDHKLMWRSVNHLDLFVPEISSDGIAEIGAAIRITDFSIGLSAHSGIPSTVVSRDENIYVVWGEATDPEDKTIPGLPAYVACYNRRTKKLSDKVLIGYGPPANDIHNSPSVTIDSQGTLHVIVGTHGSTFKYACSVTPGDISAGFTEAVDIGSNLRQTYVGLVCDPDDTLHLVFRIWGNDTSYFPASHHAELAHMSKRPGAAWSQPKCLVVAPFSEYSIYYHRLTIDRRGSLFLSYDHWSTSWFYRNDLRQRPRTLINSPDAGKSWKLVTNELLRF
ncbi:MAG: BNR-4 repeat-containing protein [Kiritimatiellae bacterium]|nr:BNR-4 repeat-containing protein [Kiritimatiellia bacterium]